MPRLLQGMHDGERVWSRVVGSVASWPRRGELAGVRAANCLPGCGICVELAYRARYSTGQEAMSAERRLGKSTCGTRTSARGHKALRDLRRWRASIYWREHCRMH